MKLHKDVQLKLIEDAGFYYESEPKTRREFDLFVLENLYKLKEQNDHLKWEISQLERQIG